MEDGNTTKLSLKRFWCQCLSVAPLHLGFARQLLGGFKGTDKSPSGPRSRATRRTLAKKHMRMDICRVVKHQLTFRVLGSSIGTCALREDDQPRMGRATADFAFDHCWGSTHTHSLTGTFPSA